MVNKKNITGIILAGGKSSRMGTDKGFVLYKGKPFIQHVLEAIKPLVDTVIIVSDNTDYDVFNTIRINDSIKNAGPLAGLYTGLNYSKTAQNLVLSCDVPIISTEVLEKLVNAISSDFDIVQLKSKNKTMPLLATYHKECAATFLALLKNDERRMTAAINRFKVKTIALDETLEHFTANINTINELNNL